MKRSNACGMRAGFIVGDENIIENYKLKVQMVHRLYLFLSKKLQKQCMMMTNTTNACIHYDKNFECRKILKTLL